LQFFKFVMREAKTSVRTMVLMGVLAGATNGIILAIINYASEAITHGVAEPILFVAFVCAIFIVSITHKSLIKLGSEEVENILHRLRTDMATRIACCELQAIEDIGRSRFLASMIQEVQVISRSVPQIVNACQAASLAVFASLYLMFISLPAFLVLSIFVAIGVLIYRSRTKIRNKLLVKAFQSETDVVSGLHDILDGAKEIRLNRDKSIDILEDFDKSARLGASVKSAAMICVANDYVNGRSLFYAILAVEIFIIPLFAKEFGVDVQKSMAVILFLLWPVNSVLLALPIMEMVTVALKNIEALREKVKAVPIDISKIETVSDFQKIEFKDVVFAYPQQEDEIPYKVGPINFTLAKGEIVFITGGNGYGKSTVLKVFSGLYKPLSGRILLDGHPTQSDQRYRSLMTSVFSDFHLFKKMYGLQDYDSSEAQKLLEMLELDTKIMLQDGKFSTLSLSSGQRKRLGLFVAMMEKRPILVLDEWAAEQDPVFRQNFYENILAWLKDNGRTVLAVTHDDKYFHTADRLMVMRKGQLEEGGSYDG